MITERRSVLLLGDSATSLMRPAPRAIQAVWPDAALIVVPALNDVERLLSESAWYPDLVVVCQSHPDEFSRGDIDRLINWFPLCRWVCCIGPWCASYQRTRAHWPLAACVSLADFEHRLLAEEEVLNSERRPVHWTAGRQEVFAFDYDSADSDRETRPLAGLAIFAKSADPVFARLMRDFIVEQGGTIATGPPAADVVLWDADPLTDHRLKELAELNHRTVIALTGWEYGDASTRLQECGVRRQILKTSPHAVWTRAILSQIGREQKPGFSKKPGF